MGFLELQFSLSFLLLTLLSSERLLSCGLVIKLMDQCANETLAPDGDKKKKKMIRRRPTESERVFLFFSVCFLNEPRAKNERRSLQ